MQYKTIDVIIPAHNEEDSIAHVIDALPKHILRHVIVVCNCCSDNTAEVAQQAGAIVLHESNKGYGWACLSGIAFSAKIPPDIMVFVDGDFSDFPEELTQLVNPILQNKAQFVLGSRTLLKLQKNILPIHQRWGNACATHLIHLFYGHKFSDLGPFRAIDFKVLQQLNMSDKTFGWTIEMQLKAIQHQIPLLEIPVRYKKRIGKSKVSGTLRGSFCAGYKIIGAVFKYLKTP